MWCRKVHGLCLPKLKYVHDVKFDYQLDCMKKCLGDLVRNHPRGVYEEDLP